MVLKCDIVLGEVIGSGEGLDLALLDLLLANKGLSRRPALLHNSKPGLNALSELLASHAMQPFHQLIDAPIGVDSIADGELFHPTD
jgi:hypothetical protein